MSAEELTRRFVNEIKLRAYDDKYIDRAEEKEILKIAIAMNAKFESARQLLADVCEKYGYVLEGGIYDKVARDLDKALGDDGKVDQAEFDLIVASATLAFRGKKSEHEVKRIVVEAMEANPRAAVKKGWFSDWYARVKSEVGLG